MSDQPILKEYTNGEITIKWQPDACIHSGMCIKGLPKVFDLKERPWVNMEGASSEAIVKAVRGCPSKALSIKGVKFKEVDRRETEVTLIPGGQLIVKGGATVVDRKNKQVHHETVSFCRCGKSEKHPYCDGTHAKKIED